MDWKLLLGGLVTGAIGIAIGYSVNRNNKSKNQENLHIDITNKNKSYVFVVDGIGTYNCVIQTFSYYHKQEPKGWYVGYLAYNKDIKLWDEYRLSDKPLDEKAVSQNILGLLNSNNVTFVKDQVELDDALEKYGIKFSWSAFELVETKEIDIENNNIENDIIIEAESEHKLKKIKND